MAKSEKLGAGDNILGSHHRYHCKFHRPTAMPPANQISDAFGKRRPLGRCGGGSDESDTCELQGCGRLRVIVVYNCVIIDCEVDGSAFWMRSKAAVNCLLVSFKEKSSSD